MAVRGGAVVAVLVVALALSSSWDTASAQLFQKRKAKQPPQKSKPGNPEQMPLDRSKYTPVVANRYHKRDYEITCTTDYGAACYIKCPARCPNKCLAYCAYCLTFCRQYIFTYIIYIYIYLYVYILIYIYVCHSV